MARQTMVDAINRALAEELEHNPRVLLLGEDVGKDGGVFRVTAGLMERFGEERVIDTPLSELGIVGSAIGMALWGFRPVAEIQFMAFIYEAMEQVLSHAARMRSRSRGRYSVPLVIRTPYGVGIKGPELHSDSTEALFCHMPGIKVVVPSTPYNALGLLKSAIRDDDPVIFLEPARLYRTVKSELPEEEFTLPLGKAELIKEGTQITAISWGTMVHRTLEATEGFDVELIDLQTLKPLDEKTILDSVAKTGRLAIVHEATGFCGVGAEIAALVAEHAMLKLRAPIIRVTAPDAVVPMAMLEDHYMPSVERIRDAFKTLMEY